MASRGVLGLSVAAALALAVPLRTPAYADAPQSAALTLAAAPATVPYGSGLTLSGGLTAAGAPVAGAPVQVLSRTAGQTGRVVLATVATGIDGSLSVVVTPRTTAEYELRYGGSAAASPALSNPVVAAVQPRMTAALAPSGIRLGDTAVLTGTTAPAYLGSSVVIRRRMTDGSWRAVTAVPVSSAGTYRWPVRPGLTGSFTFAAELSAHPAHLAATSPALTLQVDARDLRRGDTGTDVLTLQRRLAAQHLDVGRLDGAFGYDVQHAVLAFQKAQGLPRTGVYDGATRTRLGAPAPIRLRYPSAGRAVEIDLRKQVLYLSYAGALQRIVDVSTGNGGRYYQDASWHWATTPVGRFAITWKLNDPNHTSPLGVLYRPAFFYAGYAIHGSSSVPAYPASHGCVRVTTHVQDGLYDLLRVGTPVAVYTG
jgi:hypothetical protein